MNYFEELEITIHQLGLYPESNPDDVEHKLTKFLRSNNIKYSYMMLLNLKTALLLNKKAIYCLYVPDKEIVYVVKGKY